MLKMQSGSEPRVEHINAISWLNESNLAAFYLVKVEAIRIGESPPAPLLTLITGPSEEVISSGNAKKEIAERHVRRKNFWAALLQRAKLKTKLHANISTMTKILVIVIQKYLMNC